MSDQLKSIYGIDLGTTYSCISVIDESGKPVVLRNFENEAVTPSVVFFDGSSVIVGNEAKKQSKLYPDCVVEMIKRSMGDENYFFEHNGINYRPEEISSLILRKLVDDVYQSTGVKVEDVVITCPAYFGTNEREATANAGRIAGLTVRSILNEPTAAAISYGVDQADDQTILVYDLGGGTFDVTMIDIRSREIRVVCTGGDHNLGGKDWDNNIVNYLVAEFQRETNTGDEIWSDPETMQNLLIEAESAKKTLTARDQTRLKVTHGTNSIRVELTRDKFEELTASLLDRTIELTRQMLGEAKQKNHGTFSKILLVGGSTRMPQVAKRMQQEFSIPCEIYDPDESVAKGAAIYGWKLSIDDEIKYVIADQTGANVEDIDLSKVSEATIHQATQNVATEFSLPRRMVDKVAGTRIINVTSKTFGIVALDANRMEMVFNLIKRNDPVPAQVTQTFGTVDDNQDSVDVRLMENLDLTQTTPLAVAIQIGNAELPMPPGMPAGSPVHVTFRLSEQGRLEVEATEPARNETVRIEVETKSVMSNEEVEQAKTRALSTPLS